MLSSLTISNFALIKKQTIDFKKGFNCLLGQSGAGKSIVIDALNFSLGAKADKTQIRSGENLMRVDAVFEDVGKDVAAILAEQEIDFDGADGSDGTDGMDGAGGLGVQLILTRTLSADGKGSIKCNGFPIPLKVLQSIAEKLADFCGQHESVGLLQAANHLQFLDRFGGEKIDAARDEVAAAFDNLAQIKKNIAAIGGDETEREHEKELLQHYVEEIDNAQLQLGEEEELKERFEFISSSEQIFEHLSEALAKLDGSGVRARGQGSGQMGGQFGAQFGGQFSSSGAFAGNVVALLHSAKSDLNALENFKDIDACRERLENCYYEVRDIAETLDDIKKSTEFDPIELERIDERLDLIKTLARKYGVAGTARRDLKFDETNFEEDDDFSANDNKAAAKRNLSVNSAHSANGVRGENDYDDDNGRNGGNVEDSAKGEGAEKSSKSYQKSNIEAILEFRDAAQVCLDALDNSVFELEKLETARVAAEKALSSAASKLSALRKGCAAEFEKQMESELDDLQMHGTKFMVNFQQTDCSRHGADSVKFLFSANVGSEVRDLNKTASGGELSRILLAFKNVMLDKQQVQTVIFDEIDAGISGLTAGKVAQKLASISKFVQVICITHTPVVASKADEFLLVEKRVADNQTFSTVSPLQKEEAVREIARLIDGAQDLSQSALAHAKNLLG